MIFHEQPQHVGAIEAMLMKEMDRSGRITVRSLDRIHARTGLTFSYVSELARGLEKRRSRRTGI